MMMAADERRDAEEAEADMARKRAVMGAAEHSHSPSLLSDAMTAKQRMMDKRLMMKVRLTFCTAQHSAFLSVIGTIRAY